MDPYKIQIIESLIVTVILLISKFTLRYFVNLKILNSYFKNTVKKDVLKIINLLLFVTFSIILVAIWSVKQENILIVASSLFTVLGVALFAEMSILSNVTACLILFFQHPIKVGDTIGITHEGKDIEGELSEITYVCAFIKTPNSGTLTIPNALFLKSSLRILEKSSKSEY